MYKRSEYHIIKNRLEEQRRFIQVVMGARQIGKSTVGKIQTIISCNIDLNIRIAYNQSHDELVLHRGNFIW